MSRGAGQHGTVMALLLLVGCSPTYAPPLRAPHSGAPGRTEEGDVAVVGAAGAGRPTPMVFTPALSYGIRDWVAVEAGADFGGSSWRMGWAGARFTHAPRRFAKNYLALDLASAVGAGWGGELCGNTGDCGGGDDRSASQRAAGGGLLGGGVAGHFSFFSIYGRVRGQLTAAAGVPATVWGDAGLGVQFRLFRTVDLYSQASYAGYRNGFDHLRTTFVELGVAVRFSTWRLRRR